MNLIFSHFRNTEQVSIVQTTPEYNVPQKFLDYFKKLFDLNNNKQKCLGEIIVEHELNLLNYLFEFNSTENGHSKCELVMLSVKLESHENPKIYHEFLLDTVQKIKNIPGKGW